MSEDKSVFLIKNYGKINVKLKQYLDARNIKRGNLASSVKAHFQVIDKWYNNNVERIDLDVLARICYVLNCKVEDIIEYTEYSEYSEEES
ncbi:MAG: helix-turn-helix transcriptional regulator [Oscillospiraceae bacterium]|nr:helix-turn-helix transcriptional regulator [Oscillospiraceae bacterium]